MEEPKQVTRLSPNRKAVIIGTVTAFIFVALGWTGCLDKALFPFTRESSIYAGTVAGLLILVFILPGFAFLAAAISFFIAPKGKRRTAGGVGLASSLATMALALLIGVPTQEKGSTPVLEKDRPITILNAIESGKEMEIRVGTPLGIRIYGREDKARTDGSFRAELMVFVPGTIERKIVGETVLQRTETKAPDGRTLFEGELSISETHGAANGILSVFGKDEAVDHANVQFQ